jgi:hypothetical protein
VSTLLYASLPNIVIISSMAPPPPDGYTKKRQRYVCK